ncbi:MAG: glutaredoxin family protein [Proteobacteria bacterium]|nr:glutaredoxin family protein [Pseudomonadota bacterium]
MDLEVQLYTKKECHLCDVARGIILEVLKEIGFEFREIDIESSNDLYERFKEEIPVVFVNGERAFTYRVNEEKLKRILKGHQPTRGGPRGEHG